MKYDKTQIPRTLADKLVIIPKSITDNMLKESKPGDLIALYVFLNYTAKWQRTNQVKTSLSYIAKALKWSKDRVINTKKGLVSLGYIEPVMRTNERTKRIEGWYIRIKYIWSKETVEIVLDIKPDQNQDSQNLDLPDHGSLDTNA